MAHVAIPCDAGHSDQRWIWASLLRPLRRLAEGSAGLAGTVIRGGPAPTMRTAPHMANFRRYTDVLADDQRSGPVYFLGFTLLYRGVNRGSYLGRVMRGVVLERP